MVYFTLDYKTTSIVVKLAIFIQCFIEIKIKNISKTTMNYSREILSKTV